MPAVKHRGHANYTLPFQTYRKLPIWKHNSSGAAKQTAEKHPKAKCPIVHVCVMRFAEDLAPCAVTNLGMRGETLCEFCGRNHPILTDASEREREREVS